jgi:hypothetical protein
MVCHTEISKMGQLWYVILKFQKWDSYGMSYRNLKNGTALVCHTEISKMGKKFQYAIYHR